MTVITSLVVYDINPMSSEQSSWRHLVKNSVVFCQPLLRIRADQHSSLHKIFILHSSTLVEVESWDSIAKNPPLIARATILHVHAFLIHFSIFFYNFNDHIFLSLVLEFEIKILNFYIFLMTGHIFPRIIFSLAPVTPACAWGHVANSMLII